MKSCEMRGYDRVRVEWERGKVFWMENRGGSASGEWLMIY